MKNAGLALSRSFALATLAWLACAAPAFAQVVPECGGSLPSTAMLPDLVNIIPHHVHVQEQNRKQRPLLRGAGRQLTPVVDDLHRPQNAELHSALPAEATAALDGRNLAAN